ncbi:MAG: short chain dehydrogenase [Gammaproteobacteria bacterium RIFCSPHIGHO2_12_FULL_35_23]|nr:MAG: short chain dehydrogenase [Gammaproteobacteria bacterium RIFCSPHIGHO2_12_FULL_35_23]
MTEHFLNKTVFITGASRGIGREIALKLAQAGANIVIAAKTAEPHPSLPGTIYTVAKEIEDLGYKALPIQVDVRDEAAIQAAVQETIDQFGGIDILINNASAISLTPTLQTPMKRFDLMMSVNMRATFACSQACLPSLMKSENPHILNLSPPISMKPKWFKEHLAYTMSKYGMSMCTLGMAEEFKKAGIAVNSLWPKTTIATAAIAVNFPKQIYQASRTPAIVADAAYEILKLNSKEFTGNFFIDEDILKRAGILDLDQYAVKLGVPLFPDLYIEK